VYGLLSDLRRGPGVRSLYISGVTEVLSVLGSGVVSSGVGSGVKCGMGALV
jgi:hypothetical protein